MTFNNTPTQEVATKYKLNWNSSHIKYLGIRLSKDLSQLFKMNYTDNNKRTFDNLSVGLLPLDFGGRIRAVKTSILPRLLNNLLVTFEIPQRQFREWNKHIS